MKKLSLREQQLTATELKSIAFDLYIQGHSNKEICEKCNGLSINTLKSWITRHGWRDLKRETEEARYQNHAREVQTMLMDNRLRVMKQHLSLSDKLSDALLKKIKNGVNGDKVQFTARELESIAKATKNITDVSARVVGLTDKSESITSQSSNNIMMQGNIINIGSKPQPVHPVQEAAVEIIEENDRPF